MAAKDSFIVNLLMIVIVLGWNEMKVVGGAITTPFNRTCFPPHFIFGTASSAYQYEGAARVGGRGPSIWDTYTHKHPERIVDHNNGDVAVDFYHRYKEDIKLMKDEGLDGFREDFKDYAEVCFKEFGDRVKVWATLNEPWTFAAFGYDSGDFPPGRCSSWMDNNGCPTPAGNSATEPYIVAHHLLLAHAAAAQLYTQNYKVTQKGDIGIVLVSNWFEPYSKTTSDAKAAQRALDFMFGWFMHPLARGKYPKSMRRIVGNRLPKFTSEEAKMVKGSFDFLGLNYYTSNYAANIPSPSRVNLRYSTDSRANLTFERNGKRIGAPTGLSAFNIVPKGLTKFILYVKKKYNNPVIYITENGMSDANITKVQQGVNDSLRVHFYRSHLLAVKAALKDGANVKGFFAWSFLDNFEWTSGYTQRFGINYINYKDNLKRYPKHSALWFKNFLLK
nr:beta-glucosidase 12-like [Ipomoea batatas]